MVTNVEDIENGREKVNCEEGVHELELSAQRGLHMWNEHEMKGEDLELDCMIVWSLKDTLQRHLE